MTGMHSSHLTRQMGHAGRMNYPPADPKETGKYVRTANALACEGATTDQSGAGLAAPATEQGDPATVHDESAGPNRC